MRHLVIGGAGFIGVNLAHHLLGVGETTIVLDDFSRRGARENAEWLQQAHADVKIVEADISREPGVLEALVSESDCVYHLAAQVAVTSSVEDPRRDFEVNALGTLNVLEAVRSQQPEAVVIYASTNKVYGQLEGIALEELPSRYAYADGRRGVSERQPLDFHSPYACSKGAADQYVRDYARVYGLKTAVLRQSCIYGPRQFGIEDQGWLAWFAIAACLGREITLCGTGKQVRDVLHVADLIDVILRAVDRVDIARGRVYNIGGGPQFALSLLEALDILEGELGEPVRRTFAKTRPGDQAIYVSQIDRAAKELDWSPRVDPRTGIGELVEWVRANRDLFVASYASY